MMCHRCNAGIVDSPALVFSPAQLELEPSKQVPNPPARTSRYYICINCWQELDQFLHTPFGSIPAFTKVCQDILKLDQVISLHESFAKDWEPIVASAEKAITYQSGGKVR